MSCLSPDPTPSVFDLDFSTATQRIADLREERRRAHAAPDPSTGFASRGRIALGKRLIALGSSLVGSGAARRPATTR